MEKSNFKYLTKITCVIFLCLLMSCERSINNKKLCMTEVDTTGIDRDVMKYIHLYMDNHKAYNSFVLIETMMFYDRDSLGIFDEKQYSSIFDIMPAIDVFLVMENMDYWKIIRAVIYYLKMVKKRYS